MMKKKDSLHWTRPVVVLMSVLWVMLIPVVFYFAMEKNGKYRLQHEKEPVV